MQLSDINYELPESLIAQRPIEPRDAARLLIDRGPAEPEHRSVRDLTEYLQDGDLLVVNDTRVLPARLNLTRTTGGAAEVLLLEPLTSDHVSWEALIRPARKLKEGEHLTWYGKPVVRVGERQSAGDTFRIDILDADPLARIASSGTMPLPPYIRASIEDPERYQTVYSREARSAAAPTAGLHFTTDLLASLETRGVRVAHVELVVGLDTFKPVTAENPLDHRIHSEIYRVGQDVLDACASARRVVAVGTTATRALESAVTSGRLDGRTELFITRGYDWKIVDVLMTNFHMPCTSLLLLVDAFVGPRWRRLYDVAISEKYRFLSFGDAMLLDRHLKADS
ncbi:MAG: tRNA preQ1(34) S-adenosylmethionine ribosyltransferase-isomerase QueA [Actinobacteria bacterium]|nr:tRNA preQ1(34) S-adenosylmethionine ribosyltransferase-isomerase QueA [Actinomycetota bacterium]